MSKNASLDFLFESLAEAGLPQNVGDIIGRKFIFDSEFGSHHIVLVGTVTGIRVSDEGGLKLEVSSREFWNGKVAGIVFYNGEWSVDTDDTSEYRYYKGTFSLF